MRHALAWSLGLLLLLPPTTAQTPTPEERYVLRDLGTVDVSGLNNPTVVTFGTPAYAHASFTIWQFTYSSGRSELRWNFTVDVEPPGEYAQLPISPGGFITGFKQTLGDQADQWRLWRLYWLSITSAAGQDHSPDGWEFNIPYSTGMPIESTMLEYDFRFRFQEPASGANPPEVDGINVLVEEEYAVRLRLNPPPELIRPSEIQEAARTIRLESEEPQSLDLGSPGSPAFARLEVSATVLPATTGFFFYDLTALIHRLDGQNRLAAIPAQVDGREVRLAVSQAEFIEADSRGLFFHDERAGVLYPLRVIGRKSASPRPPPVMRLMLVFKDEAQSVEVRFPIDIVLALPLPPVAEPNAAPHPTQAVLALTASDSVARIPLAPLFADDHNDSLTFQAVPSPRCRIDGDFLVVAADHRTAGNASGPVNCTVTATDSRGLTSLFSLSVLVTFEASPVASRLINASNASAVRIPPNRSAPAGEQDLPTPPGEVPVAPQARILDALPSAAQAELPGLEEGAARADAALDIAREEPVSTPAGTRRTLRIAPKPGRLPKNVTVYERIPKSVATSADLIRIEGLTVDEYAVRVLERSGGAVTFEVKERDPLLVWHFAEIKEPVEISYEVQSESLESTQTLVTAEAVDDSKTAASEPASPLQSPSAKWRFWLWLPAIALILLPLVHVFLEGRRKAPPRPGHPDPHRALGPRESLFDLPSTESVHSKVEERREEKKEA